MEDFIPAMGRHYAERRNYDLGAGNHKAVSSLSPYIRRRLIAEAEVVDAALRAHGPEGAEKFVQEVLWRGYFKGWLERRPGLSEFPCMAGRLSDTVRPLPGQSGRRRERRTVPSPWPTHVAA